MHLCLNDCSNGEQLVYKTKELRKKMGAININRDLSNIFVELKKYCIKALHFEICIKHCSF